MSGFDLNSAPPVPARFEEEFSQSRSQPGKRSLDLNAAGTSDDEFVDCVAESGAEDDPDVEVFLHPIHGEEKDLKTGEFMYEFKEEVILDSGEKPSQNPCSEKEEPRKSNDIPTREEGEHGRGEEPDDGVFKEPAVGMKFRHFTELEAFLNSYSMGLGFACKRGSSSNMADPYAKKRKIRFECSRGGLYRAKANSRKRNVATKCVNCKFHVTANSTQGGVFRITSLDLNHNHDLDPEGTRYMAKFRYISETEKQILIDNDRAGVPLCKSYMSLVLMSGGPKKMTHSERDSRNFINKIRRLALKKGDFAAMKGLFDKMREKDKGFVYTYDVDEQNRLRNVFWVDGRAVKAYMDFGDIITIDSTYVCNRYRMPLVLFIGVNHHGQSILLGCALVSGEDTENYKWLFSTWLAAMGGKAPQGILTDQCQAICNAIKAIFPETRHRWCLWHILENARRHMGQREDWEEMRKVLQGCLHDSLTVSEFEEVWSDWVETYKLEKQNWVNTMYEQRKRWVPIYFKDNFWAGMSSTQRSEGMNFFLKTYVNENTTLSVFVEQYGSALARKVKEEDSLTHKEMNSKIILATELDVEVGFQTRYSGSKYKEVQLELDNLKYVNAELLFADEDEELFTYEVHGRKARQDCPLGDVPCTYQVTIKMRKEVDVKCQCKNFDFNGILCSHIFRVLQIKNVRYLPAKYFIQRWMRDQPREYLKIDVAYYELRDEDRPIQQTRYLSLSRGFEKIATEAMIDENYYQEVINTIAALSDRAKFYEAQRLAGTAKEVDGKMMFGRRRKPPAKNESAAKKKNGAQADENKGSQPSQSRGTPEVVHDPLDMRRKGRAPKYSSLNPKSTSKRAKGANGNSQSHSQQPPATYPPTHYMNLRPKEEHQNFTQQYNMNFMNRGYMNQEAYMNFGPSMYF